MKILGCCGVPEGPTFISCVFRNGEAVNITITETVSLSGDAYTSPLIYTSFYSEACVHTGCCCRAEASGALVRPLVITLSLCFHTAPGSVWIRSACDWSHLMFTLQWLIRAAVTMSEGGRKLKTNSPIRQNHVLLIGGGRGGLTAVLQGWQQKEVFLLINTSCATTCRFLTGSSLQHIWYFSHFYMVWKLLNIQALLSCHVVYLHLEFQRFGWSSRCFFTAGNGDEEPELCCKVDAVPDVPSATS